MCLIVFAWRVIPGVPVIACANRDEFYDRPATPAGPWPETRTSSPAAICRAAAAGWA